MRGEDRKVIEAALLLPSAVPRAKGPLIYTVDKKNVEKMTWRNSNASKS